MDNKISYFDRYLSVAPFSHALARAIEAGEISKIKYKRPVLDIGCGFGEFAGVFFNSGVEVGIDISSRDLILAKKCGKYEKLFLADTRRLPFPDKSFPTVISVSVLEHIPNVELALKEIFRVLEDGGVFIFTAPTDKFYNYLFYTQVFEKLGLSPLAKLYYRLINRAFKHINIISGNEWQKKLRKKGFKVNLAKEIISKKATMIFDIFLLSALPSQFGRVFFGKRFVWNIKSKNWILKKFFTNVIISEEKMGSNIILVAQKPIK